MADAIVQWTIAELGVALRARRVSAVEVTDACLARIGRLDPSLRAFITIDADGARRAARSLDGELAAGRARGPLHGVPLAYKDLCAVPGLSSSCGTKTAEYFVSPVECTAVARLARAGAITLGKLNMTELALGPFGDNAHHGDAQNPWKVGHCAGGSSSGSGVALAARLAFGALGSDTGGSIRLPAACCGIVGLKPTYGRVSRAGAMPLSWSLDHIGPMARTVRDAAALFEAIAGHDPEDATTSRRAVGAVASALDAGAAGLRVGVPENYYFDGADPEVERAVREAARALALLGAAVREVRLPDPRSMVDVCTAIARSESAVIHRRVLVDRPHELQPVVRARLETGLAISAHDYIQALRLRSRLTRAFVAEVFAEVDALVLPSIPEPAPSLEAAKTGSVEDVVRRMGRFSRLTRPFNGLGLPALALPCGFSADGRPLSMQIVARPFDEPTALRLGSAYEREAGWAARRPPEA